MSVSHSDPQCFCCLEEFGKYILLRQVQGLERVTTFPEQFLTTVSDVKEISFLYFYKEM